jgi:hypothetical protein
MSLVRDRDDHAAFAYLGLVEEIEVTGGEWEASAGPK